MIQNCNDYEKYVQCMWLKCIQGEHCTWLLIITNTVIGSYSSGKPFLEYVSIRRTIIYFVLVQNFVLLHFVLLHVCGLIVEQSFTVMVP